MATAPEDPPRRRITREMSMRERGSPSVSWMPDSQTRRCLSCKKKFSLTVRKHHCRLCGKIFCNDCSSRRMALPSSGMTVRVCEPCYVEWGRQDFRKRTKEDRRRQRGHSDVAKGAEQSPSRPRAASVGGVSEPEMHRGGRMDTPDTVGSAGKSTRGKSAGPTRAHKHVARRLLPEDRQANSAPQATRARRGVPTGQRESPVASTRRHSARRRVSKAVNGASAVRRLALEVADPDPMPSPARSVDSATSHSYRHQHGHSHTKLAPGTRFARRVVPVLSVGAEMLVAVADWRRPFLAGGVALTWVAICHSLSVLLILLHITMILALGFRRTQQLIFGTTHHSRDDISYAEYHLSEGRTGDKDAEVIVESVPESVKEPVQGFHKVLSVVADLMDWFHLIYSWREPDLSRSAIYALSLNAVLCLVVPAWAVVASVLFVLVLKSSQTVRLLKRMATTTVSRARAMAPPDGALAAPLEHPLRSPSRHHRRARPHRRAA